MLLASLMLCLAPQHGGASQEFVPTIAAASGEGAAALDAMALPEGWTGALWAAEPLLANPVAFSIDDKGEVYVCETYRLHKGVTDMREYMGWLHDELACTTVADRRAMFEKHLTPEELVEWSSAPERVRLVRDTNGDGVADTSTVFADGFDDLMDGIAAGVLNVDGDVYYTCIPHLWRLRDEDGDGVSDSRESLAHGFGVHVALLGHDLHGLVLGPDRRLYFSCGDRGINLTTGSGAGIKLPHEGAVLRCELDGSDMQVVHKGLRNPQELAFDIYGDLFTGDNNSDGGDQARWVHVVPGGDSGWRHHYQYVTDPVVRGPWNDELMWKPKSENKVKWVNPPIMNIAAGPSGLDVAPGTGHPPELDNHFFLCDFRGTPSSSGVTSFSLEREGAFYKLAEKERFLWKTLITDFQFGPDGYAYWTDWVAGWGMTGKGRVYRMGWEGADDALVEETRQLLAGTFDAFALPQLEGLLAHPDRRVRQRTHFALADRGDAGVGVLTKVAAKHPQLMARLHAIWGLWVAGKTNPAATRGLMPLLSDTEGDVRSQAARVLGDLRASDATPALVVLLDDGDARVRFHAAIACGHLQAAGALPGIDRMLIDADATDDPNLRHAAVQALTGCVSAEDLPQLESDTDAVALGYLLALRVSGSPEHSLALFKYLDRSVPLALEAMRAIWDGDAQVRFELPTWPGVAPGQADERWIDRAAQAAWIRSDERMKELTNNASFMRRFAAGNNSASLRNWLIEIARWDIDDSIRTELLGWVAAGDSPSPIDPISGRWAPLEATAPVFPGKGGDGDRRAPLKMLTSSDLSTAKAFPGESAEVQTAWLRLISELRVSNAERSRFLVDFFIDTERPGDVRAHALRSLLEDEQQDAATLVDRALADDDADLRAAALAMLVDLDPEVALVRLRSVLKTGTLPERRAAYGVLHELPGDDVTSLLTDELVKLFAGLVSPELRLDLILAGEARDAAVIRSLLNSHRAVAEALDPALAPYLDGFAGGDDARGKKLFESTELSCLRCHSVGGDWSAQIGPSLHDVALRLPQLDLLASIVDPNRQVASAFETEMFFPFEDGSPVVGRVLLESPESVQVIDSDGELHMLQKSEIEVRRKDLSAMPNGLADQISPEQMRDLLAYLATLKNVTK